MKIFAIIFLMILTSCSFSVNQVHTEGSASDVIDESQSPQTALPAGIEGLIKKLQA